MSMRNHLRTSRVACLFASLLAAGLGLLIACPEPETPDPGFAPLSPPETREEPPVPRAVPRAPHENVEVELRPGLRRAGTSGVAHRVPGPDRPDERRTGTFAVASRDPLATNVAHEVLLRGGTAADAAFALGVAISVSEPHFSHALGGGTWALYYNSSRDEVRALDGVGTSGSRVELEFFQDPERNVPYGSHRVIVPGAWDAWAIMLRDEGELHMDELMEPAIRMARDGVPASRSMVSFIRQEETNIAAHEPTARVFLRDGEPPRVGELVVQHDLANSLRGLADVYRRAYNHHEGSPTDRRLAGIEAARDHYYRGPIAAALSRFLEEDGGFVTSEDFARFAAQWREPIYTTYRDTLVYGSPPNSQGASMLIALNLLERMDLSGGPDDPLTVHRMVEATKLGKIDTWHYVAEPESMPLHVDALLAKEYATYRAWRIRDESVITWPEAGGMNLTENASTTTFAVVDADGNATAVTTSTGAQFLVGGDTGILLNQRMAIMELAEANPNVIAPNKKPRHTVNPYMAFREGRFLMAGGNTGFDTQPQGQVQQFINVVEFGMTPQEAVSHRRFVTHAFPASHHPHRATNELFLEAGTPSSIAEGLRERGHIIGRSGIIGNANIIHWNQGTGRLEFGVDPRGENSGVIDTPRRNRSQPAD